MTFWNGEKLLERLPSLISNFRSENIDCAAYTLSVGSEVYVSPSAQLADPAHNTIRQLSALDAFVIPPGQFAFLLTQETVSMPADAIGFISMKATIKFRGLINVSGFHVDPGYRGRLIFAVFNAGPVPFHLRQGDACFLIWYADLNSKSEKIKTNDPVATLPASYINGISGELYSLESLGKKIKDIEKVHNERIHAVERELSLYKVVAGVVLTLALTCIGLLIKDCGSEQDTRATPARIDAGADPSAPAPAGPAPSH